MPRLFSAVLYFFPFKRCAVDTSGNYAVNAYSKFVG